jgi:1,4-dihydroxy-2-naphthoyl-CoA hydrolase
MDQANITEAQLRGENSLVGHLGIEYLDLTPGNIVARMPVDHRTMQPFGRLHGGASMALAETIGSLGSYLLVKEEGKLAVGIEINANHVRAARSGWVTGTGKIIHQGKSTHVWEIRIEDEEHQLVCISRFTVAIIEGKG